MTRAELVGIDRADYLGLLLEAPAQGDVGAPILPDVPPQSEVDRLLSSDEEWVSGATRSTSVSLESEPLVGVAR
jgi:hypothetical protein